MIIINGEFLRNEPIIVSCLCATAEKKHIFCTQKIHLDWSKWPTTEWIWLYVYVTNSKLRLEKCKKKSLLTYLVCEITKVFDILCFGALLDLFTRDHFFSFHFTYQSISTRSQYTFGGMAVFNTIAIIVNSILDYYLTFISGKIIDCTWTVNIVIAGLETLLNGGTAKAIWQ